MCREPVVLRSTKSVCPECFKTVSAQIVKRGEKVFIEKYCPEHGRCGAVIWNGRRSYEDWVRGIDDARSESKADCFNCQGLCGEHLNGTCCVVCEVTHRCNLRCKYCFADPDGVSEPSFDEISESIRKFVVQGETLVQISGGEPTVRDDLPEIVRRAKELGCAFVQLNSNGIRLAEEPDFVKELADAGLSFVFMQFDSLRDRVYEQLRGRALLDIKKRAIENCSKRGIGVTLVPTVVPGVNTNEIGSLVTFAAANSPAVRGIHFQPVAYIGRVPERPDDAMRFPLDELMYCIEKQTGGSVRMKNLVPSRCDHPMCGFHGDFVVLEDGSLHALTEGRKDAPACCCGSGDAARKNREFVARRWKREKSASCCCDGGADLTDMDYFLSRVKSNGFTITSMYFQDAGNIELERLRRCSLHVFSEGRLTPFCAHYLSKWR